MGLLSKYITFFAVLLFTACSQSGLTTEQESSALGMTADGNDISGDGNGWRRYVESVHLNLPHGDQCLVEKSELYQRTLESCHDQLLGAVILCVSDLSVFGEGHVLIQWMKEQDSTEVAYRLFDLNRSCGGYHEELYAPRGPQASKRDPVNRSSTRRPRL